MAGKFEQFKAKVQELADRGWDIPAIQARYEKLVKEGIPKKTLRKDELLANKEEILDRVHVRAEEYNLYSHNCPQGTALALLEEFGVGNLEIIKALCPFPGVAGIGELCGGITGGLIAIGLIFGSDDITDLAADGQAIDISQEFIAYFEDELGYITCAELQEKVVFGKNLDPGASPENMEAFAEAKGFEKCGLIPGIGARLAAEVIISRLPEN
jgi:C_GCAxxG_C_C family probable redox protein